MMPGNTSSGPLHYVYGMESERDGKRYIGYTSDLRRRTREHMLGESRATRSRLPMKLVSFEGCLVAEDAKRRERHLKTSQGRRFLGLRLL